jgi:hypothetical protein
MSEMSTGRKTIPLPSGAIELSREQVEMVAWIIGRCSAAAAALERADEHDGPVRFWYSPGPSGMLSVELLAPQEYDA